MRLAEALSIVNHASESTGAPVRLFMACGFEPLHLRTFLTAHLAGRMPGRRIELEVGLFGDLAGNLERARAAEVDGVVVCIEWADLHPRLDLRRLGGWQPAALVDMVSSVEVHCDRLLQSLTALAGSTRVVLSLPGLPLPPVFFQASSQMSTLRAGLRRVVAELAENAAIANIRVVNEELLDGVSLLSGRLDVKSALETGYPYSLVHTSVIAEHLAALLHPSTPKKGLITDLDGTMWRGILGDDGLDAVSWSLEHHSQIHGLYQQTLAALAETGVLIGVVSKNDPNLARQALARADLLVPVERIFPVDASWGLKSEGVERILQAWNIGAESVVFVDDSPWEIAEVRRAFPQMACLRFAVDDPQQAYSVLSELRDMFGKDSILAEDTIRAESVKRISPLAVGATPGLTVDTMIREAEGEIDFVSVHEAGDARPLELINKTNQFNLNGRRLTEADFESRLRRHGGVFLMCSYRDKFGPLGRVLVLLGQQTSARLTIDSWVMSCRAFSRRIEFAALDHLYGRLGVEEITFDFEETSRNGPIREFLTSILGTPPTSGCRMTREHFTRARPALFHAMTD